MELLSNVHLGAVIATLLTELSDWNWDKPFCTAVFAFFMVGFVAQFLLLRMKWKPWIISLTLGCLVIVLDFMCMVLGGFIYELFGLMEMFFLSALTGAGLAGAIHIFWEIFKKRPEGEDSVWMLRKKDDK